MAASAQSLRACFLVGPTAVGKSAVAQWIAEREGREILSADAMQVYRGMDVGTAKPTAAERSSVRYHGIDLVAPGDTFSVWEYRAHALRVLSAPVADESPMLIVGGTGLYAKSLASGLAPVPGALPEARQRWEAISAAEGVEPLRRELKQRNPELYDSVKDKDNVRRLIRALELDRRGHTTGPGTWRAQCQDTPFAALRMPPEPLKSRIELRVLGMYRHGLLEEVERLLGTGNDFSVTAGKAIGYREAIDVVRGHCSAADAQRQTIKRTWQLARRQMTWFRHQADVRWIEIGPDDTVETLALRVMDHWREYGPTRIVR